MKWAVAVARERLRWWRPKPAMSIDEWTQVIGETDSNTPLSEGEIVLGNRSKAVRDAVASLPLKLREITVLFEYEGVSQPEIAALLGMKAKAVEAQLFRGRATRPRRPNVD